MRNKIIMCIETVFDSNIKFEEQKKKIIFRNPNRLEYKRVQIDGCTLIDGIKCDNLLLSADEYEERYVELKGVDVMHAIDQLESTIQRVGEYDVNRHAYVICTNSAPAIRTNIQAKKLHFKKNYKSTLTIKEKEYSEALY